MSKKYTLQYFLGANSANGFYSLYDEFVNPSGGDFVWYVKGGPGSGKSTFMRRAAEAAEARGFTVEYVLCSGDPTSLDGIYIRELRTAYVDATSPHVQEPPLPGAAGRYVDLSAFYKKSARFDTRRIEDLFGIYRRQYARAYDYLRAAALCSPERIPGAVPEGAVDEIKLLAKRITADELPEGEGHAVKRRFLSAHTGAGKLCCLNTLRSVGRVRRIRSDVGLQDAFLRSLADGCRQRGLAAILLPDPLLPETLEGVSIPKAGVTFLSSDRPGSGALDLDASIRGEWSGATREEMGKCVSLRSALIKQGERALKKAGDHHAELEEEYHAAMDFTALSRFTARHIRDHITAAKI